MVIAIAVALRPSVILLDEPTSALDPGSVELTEAVLKECGSACVWVSHDPTQPKRVGGRVLELPSGECWSDPLSPFLTLILTLSGSKQGSLAHDEVRGTEHHGTTGEPCPQPFVSYF